MFCFSTCHDLININFRKVKTHVYTPTDSSTEESLRPRSETIDEFPRALHYSLVRLVK